MRKWFTALFLSLGMTLPLSAQTAEEAQALHSKGLECFNAGKVEEGRAYTLQAMEMRRALFGEVNEDYITSLNNYALSFTFGDKPDFAKARDLQTQAMALCDQLPAQHKNYGKYAFNMGRYCYLCQDMTTAATYWERALPLVEKHSEVYEHLLEWLAAIYQDRGDRQNLQRIMVLSEEHNQHELAKDCHEPQCMLDRAKYYTAKGEAAKAKECFLTLLAMPMDWQMQVDAWTEYAQYLSSAARDHVAAADYFAQAAGAIREHEGMNRRAANLFYRSGMMAYIGKAYDRALTAYAEASAYYTAHPDTASQVSLAKVMVGMGNVCHAQKDYARSADCFARAVAGYKTYAPEDEDYPKTLLRQAKAEKYNKDYDLSIAHHREAMAFFRERGMDEAWSDAETSLRLCYAYAGRAYEEDASAEAASRQWRTRKLQAIIDEEKGNLELTRQYLGRRTYAQSLGTIAGCYASLEDWTSSVDYYGQYVAQLRDAVREDFRMQTEEERMHTWSGEQTSFDQMRELQVQLLTGDEALLRRMTATMYDATLLSKGILLNSSIEFSKIVAASGDAALQQLFEDTRHKQQQIETLRANAASEDDLQRLLALQQDYDRQTLQLYQRCADIADYTNYISYTWQDVKARLRKGDVAVEFVAVDFGPLDEANSMMALVLEAGAATPVAVKVCSLEAVEALANTGDAMFARADNPVWGALRSHLTGKQRLFFSADGAFNSMAIEYLQYDGRPLSEQFDVYRLSSTKELCFTRAQESLQRVSIFGDIDYNDGDAPVAPATDQRLMAMRDGADGTFANLEATAEEIGNIARLFQGKGITPSVFRAEEATEQVFKALSDSRVNVLHIATHGKYSAGKDASDQQSMAGSILAFAGANMGGDADSDGIVTAADVAAMNLRHCDLAVLSACESGLGKTAADGVFGLQRGFKNAGVHCLLMSMKPVYDQTTALLMTSFYSHLLSGKTTRHEALRLAQKDLREAGYTAPKYWAVFILLDAL